MEQYKRILLKEFDSSKGHHRINQSGSHFKFTKGTELYLSDIHGEFEGF